MTQLLKKRGTRILDPALSRASRNMASSAPSRYSFTPPQPLQICKDAPTKPQPFVKTPEIDMSSAALRDQRKSSQSHIQDQRKASHSSQSDSQDQRKNSLGDAANPHHPNSSAYLSYPVKHVVSSLYRRMTEPPDQPVSRLLDAPALPNPSEAYTPPNRTRSPYQPPPLTPLTLKTSRPSTPLLLTRSLAEEIRLLVPPRLQLVDSWQLAYSLEANGASLATLYQCCEKMSTRSQRAGYVLVVRDASSPTNGSVFGAYLTDPPRPYPHYYGTGECFLWRATILPSLRHLQGDLNGNGVPPSQDLLELAGLPPPPSADTTNLQRITTFRGETSEKSQLTLEEANNDLLQPPIVTKSGTSTPDRIRFKAFPYSGINDFMILCEHDSLSVGGGEGRTGLWIDDALETGISEACPTFGNEPLSDAGHKFDVLGVEIWYIGA